MRIVGTDAILWIYLANACSDCSKLKRDRAEKVGVYRGAAKHSRSGAQRGKLELTIYRNCARDTQKNNSMEDIQIININLVHFK